MKIKIVLAFFISLCGILYSQTDLSGMWKEVVDAGMKQTTPTYMQIRSDGTYTSQIDSTKPDPMKSSITGKWSLVDGRDIRFAPDNTTYDVRIYSQNIEGKRYTFEYNEKDGKKEKSNMLEMTWYIEKISDK